MWLWAAGKEKIPSPNVSVVMSSARSYLRHMTLPKRDTILKTLRNLSGARPSPESSFELWPFGLLKHPSTARDPGRDREIALVSTSVLGQALEVALLSRFSAPNKDLERQLFFDNGSPLGSLFGKTVVARALGIIGERARADLSVIRSIRNSFAHSRLSLTFETLEVSAACELINLPSRWPAMGSREDMADPRELFIQTCFQLTLYLTMYGEEDLGDIGQMVLDLD